MALTTAQRSGLKRFVPRSRRYARPGDLARFVDSKNEGSPALQVIDDALIALTEPDSEFDALEVTMPPQEGKSQRVSRTYAEWLLDHNPRLRIAIISYAEEISLRWGRDIKMDVAQHPCAFYPDDPDRCDRACGGLHITIRQDSRAAGRWQTPQGGGIYCVGVGGPLAGQPVDILIIDDPVKDRAAAESKVVRDSTWDWWESVAIARLAPGSRIVMITTRWHEDDLAGRIAARPSPLKWKRLRIPAIADSADDPLGREIGQELPSVRHRVAGYFRNLKANMSPYVFAGVYQQSPAAAEGNFFRRESFRYWRPMEPWADGRERLWTENGAVTLADCWTYVTMDFAASTKASADYTVAACWAITPGGDLILLDRVRNRVPDHEHFAMAEPLMQRWGASMVYVESNWWSKTFVSDARDKGVAVAPLLADTDKVTRAIPAAGRVHAGRVYFPAETSGCPCGCEGGVWLAEFENELAIFPQGSHDDQVDVTSYAARVQSHEWTPAQEAREGLHPWEGRVVEQAIASGTGHIGNGSGDLDLMNVPF
jgi:predicted phage terminase large subunit-like protein